MKKILIIEDDSSIAELERDYLEINDFECEIAARGTTGLEKALAENFDLIIIDIMLPGMDGFEVITELRKKKQTPVIFLSAKNTDIDKIRGLGLGADDYMTKPFSLSVLLLKIEAHFRRRKNEPGTPKIHTLTSKSGDVITVGKLMIDKDAHKVTVDGKEISLTAKEYDLLLFLAENPNHTFSKEILFDRIWGMDAIGDVSTVTVHIQRVRDKINTENERYIETIWGVGYRFNI
jgi:DNA-binding response OmpR family regulator